MENTFEIYDMNSGLEYIKSVEPAVYEELLLEFKEIDEANEIESVEKYRKNLALGYAVLEAFELSGADAVITKETAGLNVAVKYLTNKSDVHISSEFDAVDSRCFEYCPFIEKLVFEEGVMQIGEEIMCYSKTLKEVSFPESVNMIGYKSFYLCRQLSKITILNPETLLCGKVFEGCTALKEAVLPEEMKGTAHNIFNKNVIIDYK